MCCTLTNLSLFSSCTHIDIELALKGNLEFNKRMKERETKKKKNERARLCSLSLFHLSFFLFIPWWKQVQC